MVILIGLFVVGGYIGVWILLSVAAIKYASHEDSLFMDDERIVLFLLFLLWPVTFIPWVAWMFVKRMTK